jgi:hypothetical protein
MDYCVHGLSISIGPMLYQNLHPNKAYNSLVGIKLVRIWLGKWNFQILVGGEESLQNKATLSQAPIKLTFLNSARK